MSILSRSAMFAFALMDGEQIDKRKHEAMRKAYDEAFNDALKFRLPGDEFIFRAGFLAAMKFAAESAAQRFSDQPMAERGPVAPERFVCVSYTRCETQCRMCKVNQKEQSK